MRVVVLINPAAGSVTADGARRVRRALHANGLHGADIVKLDAGDIEVQMRKIVEESPDLFIVWGGDGTHRAALSTVGLSAVNLLLLPGGTMNLLSKSLHGAKPWEHILTTVLAGSEPHILPAGLINGQVFYCAMLAGAPVRLAEARESLRHGDIGKGVAQLNAAVGALQTMHLMARYGDGYRFNDEQLPTTSVIGALVGPMSRNGRMEVFTLEHPSAMSALDIVWSSLRSSWRDARDVAIVPAETLVIDSEEGERIPVIIDGESIIVGNHISVTYVPAAARCLTALVSSIGQRNAYPDRRTWSDGDKTKVSKDPLC